MNEFDIKDQVDKLIKAAETKLETVFANMLKQILSEMNRMYVKYAVNGSEPSWTDLNKYNRLQSTLKRITDIMTNEYREVVKLLEQTNQNIYLETYMQEAYLLETFSGVEMGFDIPTQAMIEQVLLNPIEFLTLPKVLEVHRNQLTRDLQIIITQNLLNGGGYYKMANEIEQKVGFNQTKARAVARTEGGRSMSIADEKVYEQAKKYVNITKMWMSALDLRVRVAHQQLDGKKADDDGYFTYKTMKAKGPHQWNRANMDINCRCTTIKLVDGYFPAVRRGRDYRDEEYQEKMKEAIKLYQQKENLTYAQAYRKAFNRIQPPNVKVPFLTYEEWKKDYIS